MVHIKHRLFYKHNNGVLRQMAEDQEKEVEEEAEDGAEKGKSKLPLILMLAGVLVLGAGLGAGIFLLVMGGDDDKKPMVDGEVVAEASAESTDDEAAEAVPAPQLDENGKPIPQKPQIFFKEVPEILVNLASRGSSTRYLKLKVSLELGSEADLESIEYVMPRVVDDFQLYLRQLRVEDLDGSAGIYRLKEDLLLRANQSAQPLKIKNVLFKEILVQ
jgi:flagellar FliL protein